MHFMTHLLTTIWRSIRLLLSGSETFNSVGLVPGSCYTSHLTMSTWILLPDSVMNGAFGLNYFVNGYFIKITKEFSTGKKVLRVLKNTDIILYAGTTYSKSNNS